MKTNTIFIIIFISFIFIGCSSQDSIDFKQANISYCENSSSDGNLIVNSMEEFEEKGCKFNDDNNTSIDFEKYTLLGKFAEINACNEIFEKKVVRDSQKKVIIYTIDVVGKGDCSLEVQSQNLVLIPKVPQDYEVEFIVNN